MSNQQITKENFEKFTPWIKLKCGLNKCESDFQKFSKSASGQLCVYNAITYNLKIQVEALYEK